MRRVNSWSGILRSLILVAALVMAGLAVPVAAQQATPDAVAGEGSITISGLVKQETTLTVADLQALPNEFLEVTYTSGGEPQDHTFTGTSFLGVIESIGLDVEEDARNPLLSIVFIITASDGYQVAISGGELDPDFGNEAIYLAWEQDGAPLAVDDNGGQIRLVVPGDTRGGRYVSGIVSVEVVTVSTLPHVHD